jgi:hypothetical protein
MRKKIRTLYASILDESYTDRWKVKRPDLELDDEEECILYNYLHERDVCLIERLNIREPLAIRIRKVREFLENDEADS